LGSVRVMLAQADEGRRAVVLSALHQMLPEECDSEAFAWRLAPATAPWPARTGPGDDAVRLD
jgi:hypothetical protein